MSVAGAYAAEPATNTVAGTGYVKTAYEAINDNKIGKTITTSGSGSIVTGITTTSSTVDGKNVTTGIQISKSNVQIPNGSASGNTYSSIWID